MINTFIIDIRFILSFSPKLYSMKILITDRDQLISQMISSRLQDEDIVVIEEPVKSDALERISKEAFDLIMIDPSPMKDAQAMVMNIRRNAYSAPYIIVLGEELDMESIVKIGGNNFLSKPIDPEQLQQKIKQAKMLQAYVGNLTDLSEDFPSAGGVIAKSAFNQLFLSAMDRGWRYEENSYVISFSIENYADIKKMDGDYHASYGVSKLASHLVHLRRQSDVIGQTAVNQYCLLLQRTMSPTEPEDAAKRFAATLDEIDDFLPPDGNSIKITVRLMSLPNGEVLFDQGVLKRGLD